jgi:hypothetical protein
MWLIFLIAIIVIIACIFIGYIVHINNEQLTIYNTRKEQIAELERALQRLEEQQNLLSKDNSFQEEKLSSLKAENDWLTTKVAKAEEIVKNQEKLSQKAFSNFCDVLDKNYEDKTKEYDKSLELLHESYESKQLQLIKEIEKQEGQLNELRSTYAAAVAARVREKEIKEQLSFYCLPISELDLADIKMLEKIKPNLNKPRVLSMLIWSTFFQKPMNTLCANVLGNKTVTGIYKITNQQTNEVYIGQAVDIATRWKQHAKCGLGIDTPQNNKLYKAMQEDGIWNFSWELLEECKSSELNKKEREYIELYQSKDYGYNTLAGNQR